MKNKLIAVVLLLVSVSIVVAAKSVDIKAPSNKITEERLIEIMKAPEDKLFLVPAGLLQAAALYSHNLVMEMKKTQDVAEEIMQMYRVTDADLMQCHKELMQCQKK